MKTLSSNKVSAQLSINAYNRMLSGHCIVVSERLGEDSNDEPVRIRRLGDGAKDVGSTVGWAVVGSVVGEKVVGSTVGTGEGIVEGISVGSGEGQTVRIGDGA